MRCSTRRHRQHPITCMLQIYRSLHSLLCVSGSSGLLQQDSAIIRSAFPMLVSLLLYYLSNCQGVASLCYVPWNSKNRFLLSLLFNHCIVIAYYHLFIYLKRFSWVSYINGSLLIIGCSFADSFTIMLIKKEIAALSKPNDVANVSYFYAIVFVCTGSKLPSMY